VAEAVEYRTGRPRDGSIDQRALAAARDLLIEAGYAGTTVQAVARQAGVHASAIYRRWPSRLDLVRDAAFADFPPGRVRPTGDLRRDLRRFVRAYVKTFAQPVVQAAMPGLMSEQSGLRTSSGWAQLSVRPHFRELLAAAPPRAVDPEVDPDVVFDLVLGAVLARVVVPGDVRRAPSIDATVDLVLRAIEPRGRSRRRR
jgi:AcrR family transcriptional regulator